MHDFLCVLGTKKNFEKGTIVLQGLVQDGGAVISIGLAYIAWMRAGAPASFCFPTRFKKRVGKQKYKNVWQLTVM